ncbi:MAG TPA: M20/M25/M40 family metallo-hydrolase [Anaerovoracaceae bacterium]|nr:M20/M25/M40 family metallo-hydrolase [Anaerovoracaceae bacterium]
MSKKWTARELLYDLVSIQSDTFTEQEVAIGKHIYGLISEQDYWKEHPELCGLHDGKDVIGRLIPWGLRKGTTDRTIILAGHFDCVEIESYGTLKPYALSPQLLKQEMLKRDYSGDILKDLQDENWEFGRGIADMKGGVACILYELFKYAEECLCPEVNILFMGIHDEEHQAEGIMQSIQLLNLLKDKYGLNYKLLLNPEPAARKNPTEYIYMDGSIGKMLPGIVVKGKLAHAGYILDGLNSALIGANIVRRIELNPEFCSEEFGVVTPPPVVLYMKDSKNEYNVSVPNYTEIYAHIPLTKNRSLPEMYEKLKAICREAANETLETYNKTYEFFNKSQEKNPNLKIDVMTYAELEEVCRKTDPEYEQKKAELIKEKTEAVKSGSQLIQTGAGFEIIEKAIEWSKISNPVIVIGLLPPYVPAVNNHYMSDFDREGMIEIVRSMLKERFGLGIGVEPYCMGMTDNSYTSCTEIESDIKAMKNMVTPKTLYGIPFEEIGKVTVPSIVAGPWGKDFHTAAERVYLPDIDETTPAVIETIIENI